MYLSQDKIFRANNVKQILFHNIFCKEKNQNYNNCINI